MDNPLTDLFPVSVRRYIYAAYSLAGLIIGALSIANVNIGATAQVYAYVGIAIGAVAASNPTLAGAPALDEPNPPSEPTAPSVPPAA